MGAWENRCGHCIPQCLPKGFEASGQEDKVIHLNWAIYSLWQSGCEWYEDLTHTPTSFGFKQCWVKHAVLYRFDEDSTILAVDVNDITIAGDSPRGIRRFKGNLSSGYGIKDIGNLWWFLGIGIDRDRKKRTISFSQVAYVQKIVECFEMEDARPLSIPISPGHSLTKSQQPVSECDIEEMKNIPYHEAIGSLMYVVIGKWPNIAYTVSYLAHFMANPGRVYWEAMKRIIRYLKGRKDTKLTLGKGGTLKWEEPNRRDQFGIEGYSDVDGNSQEHQHIISRYTCCIDSSAVSWNSHKQALVSLLTTKSKYVAMTHAAKEAI